METPEAVSVESSEEDEDDLETAAVETPDEEDETDIEEATIEPTEEELGGGLFDSVDEADEQEDDEDDGEETQTSSQSPAVDDTALDDVINDGAARLAIIGLTAEDFEGTQTPSDLENELREVFEAFRLGHFGSRAVEKHVLAPGDKEIDPVWGLFGAMLMAAAITLMMRPDGTEKVGDLREVAERITGGMF